MMLPFETLEPEACELAWELFMSGDAASLDDAAALASDILFAIHDYAEEWDAALALAQQAQP